jgi:hypothetical protein
MKHPLSFSGIKSLNDSQAAWQESAKYIRNFKNTCACSIKRTRVLNYWAQINKAFQSKLINIIVHGF